MPGPGSVAWPNPELSIGRKSLQLRRKKVWEAKGPALERFENDIFKVINDLLDAHKEQLESGEQISRTYSFHLWMVGREAESAVPTIIFTSKSAKLREKVTKLIRKHEILDNFPGFALNSMDRMPAVPLGPPSHGTDASRLEDRISVTKGDAVYALREPIDVCGTLVSTNGDDETTLGGTIIIGDDFYGFIALHPREDESGDSESIICRNSDLRFDDESDVTSTATASLRPSASLRSARNSTFDLSNPNSSTTYIEENKYNPRQKRIGRGGSKISLAQSTHINTTINHAERLIVPRQIGTVVAESTRNGLHYGIFRIDDPQYRIPNRIPLPFNDPREGRYLYPQDVASEVQEGDAWIASGKSGLIKGTIIKNPYFIKLAGSDKYQKMWPIQLEQDIVPGDCGSWVVDSRSGRLYGHVVAGDSTLHRAYFIQALDVFEDIRNKMNASVLLPVLPISSDLSTLSKSYANAVSSISEESSSYSLYPGTDYFSLAEYLSRPERFMALSPPTVAKEAMPIHVVVHEIDNLQRTISHFRDPADFHWYTTQRSATKSNLLIFLKGISSPDWIRTIGADYSVDPEFFRVHLDSLFHRTNFSLPSPPSSSRTLRLRLTTLGMGESMKSQSANSWRNRCIESMQAYRKNLRSLKFPLATSIIRNLSCFGDGTFALEQELSVSVIELQGRWIVLIWSDVGLPLHQGLAPWTDQFPLSPISSSLLPIMQARPKNGLNVQDSSGVRSTGPSDTWAQNAAILPSQYGKTLKTEIMQQDPLYAMSELLRFVSFSEMQFLNMINSQIDRVSNTFNDNSHHISRKTQEGRTDSFHDLYYIKRILASHIQRLEENISMIKTETRVSQKRPRNLDAVSQAIVEATAESLLEDFEHLLHRANLLSTLCESCMTALMHSLAIIELDRGRSVSSAIISMTLLTMIFLPATFVSTFFGMNLYEWEASPITNSAEFRVYFYVTIPLILATFLVWWIAEQYGGIFATVRGKKRFWKEKVL